MLGTPISISWYRQQPDEVADMLREAGFTIWAITTREAEGAELTTQGYLIARKPESRDA